MSRRKPKDPDKMDNSKKISLKPIQPLTQNQHKVFKAFYDEWNILLHGSAGTGKTLLAIYLGLKELSEPDTTFTKLVLIRSAVPTRDVGFMPGSLKEKIAEYEAPYYGVCEELTGREDAYTVFKQKGIVEFVSTSYIRGITLSNCIVIVDEIQNMDFDELATIITRLGDNTRIIFCGDFKQSDFRGHEFRSRNDVKEFMNVIMNMRDEFITVEFGVDDIVRSALVKSFIIACEKLRK